MHSLESLIRELDTSALDPTLRRRCKEVLIEGCAAALALEGERRRLRRRQQELAGLSHVDPGSVEEVFHLARSELALATEERRLRDLLARLREREVAAVQRQVAQ